MKILCLMKIKKKELKRMQEWVNKVLENRKLEESPMSKVAEYIFSLSSWVYKSS